MNVIIVFTVSGFWHGADFHFIVWGFSYSIPLILEKRLGIKQIGAIPVFLQFALFGVFFRSPDMSTAFTMLGNVFSFQAGSFLTFIEGMPNQAEALQSVILLALFILTERLIGKVDMDESISKLKSIWRWTVYYAILLAIVLFGVMDNAPQFIYFQF
jgi:alginate O-acetyltransferase complex protein AlgI